MIQGDSGLIALDCNISGVIQYFNFTDSTAGNTAG